jgi:hypothetical protein
MQSYQRPSSADPGRRREKIPGHPHAPFDPACLTPKLTCGQTAQRFERRSSGLMITPQNLVLVQIERLHLPRACTQIEVGLKNELCRTDTTFVCFLHSSISNWAFEQRGLTESQPTEYAVRHMLFKFHYQWRFSCLDRKLSRVL